MQRILFFNCFELCLLIVFCTAAPAQDSDMSSGEAAKGRIVKLQASKGDSDLSSGDGSTVHKLQAPVGDSDLSSGNDGNGVTDAHGEDVLSDHTGANGETNKEGNASVANDDNQNRENDGVQDDSQGVSGVHDAKEEENETEMVHHSTTDAPEVPVNEDEKDYPVADEKIDDEKVQDNSPELTDKLTDSEKKDSQEQEKPLSSENMSEDKEDVIRLLTRDCKSGNTDCTYNIEKLSSIPGFHISSEEFKKFKLWDNAKIPYYIDELSYDKVLRDKIRSYLDDARPLTGLIFEELTEPPVGDTDRWVFFINRRGQLDCKDYNTNSFTNTGVQKVIIGYNCLEHGGPMAAVVLALAGVPAQHNAPDRDRYITVVTENILPEKRGLFRPVKDSEWLFHDLPYDFYSVSHYPSHKYTADGSETIKLLKAKELKDKRKPLLRTSDSNQDMSSINNEKRTYSAIDLLKIRYLYNNILSDPTRLQVKEHCSALYKPGPNFNNFHITNLKKAPARPKPKEYIIAVKNEGGSAVDLAMKLEGENLSRLSDEQ